MFEKLFRRKNPEENRSLSVEELRAVLADPENKFFAANPDIKAGMEQTISEHEAKSDTPSEEIKNGQ